MDKKSILIVDDDPKLRKTISDILKAKGYTPITAATGKEALDRVKEEGPALALIDLKLEDMSGLDVLREIKECSPDTECIVITGYASQESAIDAVNLGAYSYVQKPYDIEQLLLSIRRAIEKREVEVALRKSEEHYRTLFEDTVDAIAITSREGKFLDVNQAALDLFGYVRDEIMEMNFRELYIDPSNGKRFQQEMDQKGSVSNFEVKLRKKDGTELDCLFTVNTKGADDGSIIGYQGSIRDITDQRKLEAQLIQSQKMEAIGTLAGGVAHDFNNLLTAIIGNAELSLMRLGKDASLREGIEEIKKAANSAASLTRQLLAFSRKQVLQPVVLNFNAVTTNLEKMLKRLIGEDVEMETSLEPNLGEVEADPGQIEQVIMNLAVNARDAMSQGGKLTIETANVDLNENYFRDHGVKNPPGPYVMLAVSDTGKGMDKETQSRIFEPFFTTKETGKGTGLGLSTVYGIIKQSNGYIWVYSEPGEGTTFKIYLPRSRGDEEPAQKEQALTDKLKGSETVLIVEDNDALRNLALKILQPQGYSLLEAQDGEEALRVSEGHKGPIDLMITDVVMPGMSGRELAERLHTLRPEMKVLYMSGYTDDAIVRHGVLAPGVNFMEKPFTLEGLARKVREVLDQQSKGQTDG